MMMIKSPRWSAKGLYVSLSLFILLIGYHKSLPAQDFSRLYKLINAGQYDEVKKVLVEKQKAKEQNVAYWFAWARFYFAPDNPAYQLDSANRYIKLALKFVPLPLEDKYTKKIAQWGVRDFALLQLRDDIGQAAFQRAMRRGGVEDMQFFIDSFHQDSLMPKAMAMRNSLAFEKARRTGTSTALRQYLQDYPDALEQIQAEQLMDSLFYSEVVDETDSRSLKTFLNQYPGHRWYGRAKEVYELRCFEETAKRNNLKDWEAFIQQHPDGKRTQQASDSLFVRGTEAGTEAAFESFIFNYPNHPRITEAWNSLYQLKTSNGTAESITLFELYFPVNPLKHQIEKDKYFFSQDLLPVSDDGKWGYQRKDDPEKKWIIPAIYTDALPFTEGIAWVSIDSSSGNKSYFGIRKNGRVAIEEMVQNPTSFVNGLSIASAKCRTDNCRYGVIQPNGKWIIAPVYDWIDEPREGFFIISKNDSTGYVSQDGQRFIPLNFIDALPFSQGIASVETDEGWGVIDTLGQWIIQPVYSSLSLCKDSLMAASTDGERWGYLKPDGKWAIPPDFLFAEDFKEGKAVVSRKETDPKNKKLKIIQRYEIDQLGKILRKITAPQAEKKPTGKKGKRGK